MSGRVRWTRQLVESGRRVRWTSQVDKLGGRVRWKIIGQVRWTNYMDE